MGAENRYYESEGIIVRKVRLGEAARILTILTPGAGKVSAVAKGVCRSKSKMSGHLELFTHSQIEFARGRNLDTVINCQTIHSFHHLKEDLLGVACATYFCELADSFSEHEMECRRMFNLLVECLSKLNEDSACTDTVRAYFEMQCLIAAGYCPQTRACVKCSGKIKEEPNFFSIDNGGIMCPQCTQFESRSFSISVTAIKVLRMLSEEKLEICIRLKLKPELINELNIILGRHISSILERPLKTPSWIAKAKAVSQNARPSFTIV